jgi:hypothetical protein
VRRRIFQLIVAAFVAALPVFMLAAPARADNATTLLTLVNGLRAAHGVAPLSSDGTLTGIAQAWSAHMAATGQLSHNPSYGPGIPGGWTKLGENVGEGGVLSAIFTALVNSPFHYSNMIDPSYNLTGIAVATGQGNTLWVTEDFEARSGGTPVVTPATVAPTPRATVAAPRPAVTAPPATHAAPAPTTVHPSVAPTAAAPTTAAAPPTTVAPSTTSVTPGSGSGASIPDPPAVAPKLPGQLAAASSLFPHRSSGGSALPLALTLSGLGVLGVGGAAYIMRKPG